MAKDTTRLFLIDGSALVYRAYFAFIRNPLITRKGEHTSAVFGFVNSLLKILKEEKPTHLAVVFDTPSPTFRHKMYDAYKATRAKMPDDMIPQLGRLREVLQAMGVPMLELAGFEADDIIGTMATQTAARGLEVIMVTGDKDYMQLVGDKAIILNPKKAGEESERIDRGGVIAKFGVPPERVIDVLALMGDTSDNVPGVSGIGPKTAVKLIQEHESLDALYADIDNVKPPTVREKLIRDKDTAFLSKKLVTIDTKVPVDWDLDQLEVKPVDLGRVEPLFRDLEFSRLIAELRATGAVGAVPEVKPQAPEAQYRTVISEQDLEAVARSIDKAGLVAIDTETSGLDPLAADLIGICLSWQEQTGVYIPIGHTGLMAGDNADLNLARELLSDVLSRPNVRWVGHHAKFDWHILERAGFTLPPFAFDTMLAAYLLDPSGRHGLKDLALDLCDHRMIHIEELIGSGKKQKSFAETPIDKATEYAAADADFTLRLHRILKPKVSDAGLDRLLYEVEQPLVRVLMDIEREGVALDAGLLRQQSGALAARIEQITHDIHTLAGHPFNVNSTQQLQKVLFDELKLQPRGRTTKKTGFATGQAVLEELAKEHDLPRLVLECRELSKLKSTYIDALPGLVDKNGRVHTSFNQTVAATGRLSSQDPNLQNIPIRTEVGRQIRKAFVARDKNHRLLAADYSQVELRVLAHISGDESLREAFANDEDVHRHTAAAVYGVDMETVTPEMRAVAKTANFAIIYGVSAYGLSQQTGMPVGDARQFIEMYFTRYPKIKSYIDSTIKHAREEGYVTTLLGRRRFLPEIKATNRQQREFAERIAINTPIQGTAADLIKVAMIGIHKRMAGVKSKMVLQVHDELVFDAHKDEVEALKDLVRDGMENALKLDVPLKVDIAVGANWLEAK
jgi:DNA polymerase-1